MIKFLSLIAIVSSMYTLEAMTSVPENSGKNVVVRMLEDIGKNTAKLSQAENENAETNKEIQTLEDLLKGLKDDNEKKDERIKTLEDQIKELIDENRKRDGRIRMLEENSLLLPDYENPKVLRAHMLGQGGSLDVPGRGYLFMGALPGGTGNVNVQLNGKCLFGSGFTGTDGRVSTVVPVKDKGTTQIIGGNWHTVTFYPCVSLSAEVKEDNKDSNGKQ